MYLAAGEEYGEFDRRDELDGREKLDGRDELDEIIGDEIIGDGVGDGDGDGDGNGDANVKNFTGLLG